MKKILFVASHRKDRSPGQRFRFEQYFEYLQQNGFECTLSFILSEKDDKIFYSPGKILKKGAIAVKSFLKRLADLREINKYDIVFVQREAFMTGSVFFEKCFSKAKVKFVFDFDDAIWLLDTSTANKRFEWLKNPEKTSKIIRLADLVITGNKFLAEFSQKHNSNVVIIPTTIDTDYHKKKAFSNDSHKICIGWTGSHTTIKHFEYGIPFLKSIKEKYGDKIYFKLIGDSSYENKELDVKGIAWNIKNEIDELSAIDIGIMPLPNDEWSKGKCGFKGLQYMALEIPTIMSPVGVNTEIINDGVNGFLASDIDEWVNKISLLIESKELRSKIGIQARKTVLERYSVIAHRDNYVKYFNELINN